VAIGKNNDSKKACTSDGPCTSADAVSANDSARTFGTVSTIAFVAGGVGVAAGAILLLTAPSAARGASAARVRVTPTAAANAGGLSVLGVF
jgi:hypothetical protein